MYHKLILLSNSTCSVIKFFFILLFSTPCSGTINSNHLIFFKFPLRAYPISHTQNAACLKNLVDSMSYLIIIHKSDLKLTNGIDVPRIIKES